MKKVVGWIRIRKGRKVDEANQKKAIEAYCAEAGVEVVDWLRGESFDEVAYGNWMGHKRIDAVVVASCADVTKNVYEFYAYRCKLRMRNSDLVAVKDEGYSGYSLYRKIFEEFTDVLARMELEHEPVRGSTKRTRKVAKGGYVGGNAPMGYRVVDGRLEVNQEEVPVVLFIMEEKHAGRTKVGTVEKLNARGFKTRRGGPFQISTVQGIWNNEEFYKGYRKNGDEWVRGQHEAILK